VGPGQPYCRRSSLTTLPAIANVFICLSLPAWPAALLCGAGGTAMAGLVVQGLGDTLGLRKSVHSKKKGTAASITPPSAFTTGNKAADRMPVLKNIGQRSSSRFRTAKKVELHKLSNLRDVGAKDRPALFVQKVQQCCALFDFTEALSDLKSKEVWPVTHPCLVSAFAACLAGLVFLRPSCQSCLSSLHCRSTQPHSSTPPFPRSGEACRS